MSVIINLMLWLNFNNNFKLQISTPIFFSSGVLILNIFLADIIYPKKEMPAYLLIFAGLIAQIFIFYYIKLIIVSGSF